MIKRICQSCKKEYETFNCINLHFCSFDCYTNSRTGKSPKGYIIKYKNCENCNNSFRPEFKALKINKRFFCSQKCYHTFNRGENHPLKGKKESINIIELKRQRAIKQFSNKEQRERARQQHLGLKHTKETREKMSKSKKLLYMLHPEKHPNRKLGGHAMVSKPQMELYLLVKEFYPEAQLEYPIRTNYSTRFADIGIPSIKLDIEFNGKYWHDSKMDEIRTIHLNEVGWRVIDFDKIDKEFIINKLKEVK